MDTSVRDVFLPLNTDFFVEVLLKLVIDVVQHWHPAAWECTGSIGTGSISIGSIDTQSNNTRGERKYWL